MRGSAAASTGTQPTKRPALNFCEAAVRCGATLHAFCVISFLMLATATPQREVGAEPQEGHDLVHARHSRDRGYCLPRSIRGVPARARTKGGNVNSESPLRVVLRSVGRRFAGWSDAVPGGQLGVGTEGAERVSARESRRPSSHNIIAPLQSLNSRGLMCVLQMRADQAEGWAVAADCGDNGGAWILMPALVEGLSPYVMNL